MTTGDGSNPGDDPGHDLDDGVDDDLDDLDDGVDDDLDDLVDDDVIERLRRLDPVDVESLPCSRHPDAMRTLEEILGPDDGTEPS